MHDTTDKQANGIQANSMDAFESEGRVSAPDRPERVEGLAETGACGSTSAPRTANSPPFRLNPNGIEANLVDIAAKRIFAARVFWSAGVIERIDELGGEHPDWPYLMPGLVDAHVHIESSLLPPTEFARLAVRHGTVATVSDPHEIANVLGVEGVRWMLGNAAKTPFQILFGAPSCVPATGFETAGAVLGVAEIETLLATPGVGYLSEVMNFPGVLAGDADLLGKIAAAKRRGLPVDGHAPGLSGAAAAAYAAAGISSDHECSTLAEAEDKLRAGMMILIREGSAARNFAVR